MSLYPVRNNNLPATPGLGFRLFGKSIKIGKFLGGALKYVGRIAASAAATWVPIFGDDIRTAINKKIDAWADLMEKSISLNAPASLILTSTTAVPTAAEEAILNLWVSRKFAPWVEAIIKEVGSAIGQTTAATKLAAINIVLQKIDTVQDHYAVAETTGLSQVAIDQRGYLIFESLSPVFESIQKIIASLGTTTTKTVTFSPTKYNFLPLFSTTPITSVVSTNYSVAAVIIRSPIIGKTPVLGNVSVGGTVSVIPSVQTSPVVSVTVPVTTLPVSVPATTPTTSPTTVVTVPSPTTTPTTPVSVPVILPTDTTTTTKPDVYSNLPQTTTDVTDTPVTEPKSNTTAYIIGGGVLIAAWALLRGKNKKSKS